MPLTKVKPPQARAGYGYAPGFFSPKVPKGVLVDPVNRAVPSRNQPYLQETPGAVIGQSTGDYRPIPSVYRGNPIVPIGPNVTTIPPPGGGGGAAGTTGATGGVPPPGYATDIESDPAWITAMRDYNARVQQGSNLLRDQLRASVRSSGYIPNFSELDLTDPDLQGYAAALDDTTIQAAQGNQMSQKAQLERGYRQGLTNLDYALAARGSGLDVHGGASTIRTGLASDQFNTASYQQAQGLLDALRGNIGGFLTTRSGALDTLRGAQSAVAQRLAAIPGPVYPAATAGAGAAGAAEAGVTGGYPTIDRGVYPGATAPTTPATQAPVQWGGQSFTTRAALTRYLNQIRAKNPRTAITAAQFAAQHPQAWARLT